MIFCVFSQTEASPRRAPSASHVRGEERKKVLSSLFLAVLVAEEVAALAKIVSAMQFAAHAKRNTLYGRSYRSKSKFFRPDELLLFPIIMGLRCTCFVR